MRNKPLIPNAIYRTATGEQLVRGKASMLRRMVLHRRKYGDEMNPTGRSLMDNVIVGLVRDLRKLGAVDDALWALNRK